MKPLFNFTFALSIFVFCYSCDSSSTTYSGNDLNSPAISDSIQKIHIQQQEALKDSLDLVALSSLRPTSTVNIDTLGLMIKFTRMDVGKRWVFDRHGDRYYYRDVDRGSKYVTIIADVSSDGNAPELPSVDIYTLVDSTFYYLSSLEWKFYRWKDYSAYLGNYADNNNDFAKTETVKFTLGVSMEESTLEGKDIYLAVGNEGCYYRRYDKFANPPYSYLNKCSQGSMPIKRPSDFVEEYTIVQKVN